MELIHGVVSNGGETAAQAFQKDGEIDLSVPATPRWIELWLFDHPPVNDRIIFGREHDAWSKGQDAK